MQKNGPQLPIPAGSSAFDRGIPRTLSLLAYGSLIRRRVHVLLLPDAGVWVGTQTEFFPPTRRKRVGFTFIRVFGLG